jgi:hypothetical protein
MRLSAVLLVASLLGVLGGAFLIGRWAVGVAIVADSVAVGVWALCRDDDREEPPQVRGPRTLQDVLDEARRAG